MTRGDGEIRIRAEGGQQLSKAVAFFGCSRKPEDILSVLERLTESACAYVESDQEVMRGRERVRLSNLKKARCGLLTALKIMKRAGNCCLIEERLRNHAGERLAKGEQMIGFPKPAQ